MRELPAQREAAPAVVAERAGGKAIAVAADVSVEADVMRLYETIDRQLGRLGALVNNAGVLERQTQVRVMDAARLQRVFATNVIGSFLCASEAIGRMSRSSGGEGGAIVNLSSLAARTGSPNEYVDYAASKGAIDSFTRGLPPKWPNRASASTRCGQASSTPTGTSAAGNPTGSSG